MKSTIRSLLLAGVVAILAGCSTLPEPKPGRGLVILDLVFDNTSSTPEPIHKVDLVLSNGKVARLVPSGQFYVFQGDDPTLSVTEMRFSLRLERWSGSEVVTKASFTLPFQPGKIVYLPYVFHYTQSNDPKHTGYYNARWNLEPQNVAGLQRVKKKVAQDSNFELWSEAE